MRIYIFIIPFIGYFVYYPIRVGGRVGWWTQEKSAVCYKYRYTVNPFLIVPIIGAMFADFINTGIITLFLNLL